MRTLTRSLFEMGAEESVASSACKTASSRSRAAGSLNGADAMFRLSDGSSPLNTDEAEPKAPDVKLAV